MMVSVRVKADEKDNAATRMPISGCNYNDDRKCRTGMSIKYFALRIHAIFIVGVPGTSNWAHGSTCQGLTQPRVSTTAPVTASPVQSRIIDSSDFDIETKMQARHAVCSCRGLDYSMIFAVQKRLLEHARYPNQCHLVTMSA